MEIKNKLNAEPVQLTIKRNQKSDGSKAVCDFHVPTTIENAAARFGADFAELAFGTCKAKSGDVDGTEGSVHLADSLTPGKHCRLGSHSLTVEGETFTTTPKMTKIKTVDGAEQVVAVLRIEIDTSKEQLITLLNRRIREGETISIGCEPSQKQLGFAPDAGAGQAAMDGTVGTA